MQDNTCGLNLLLKNNIYGLDFGNGHGWQTQLRPWLQSPVQPLLVQFSWRSLSAHHTSPPTITTKQINARMESSAIVNPTVIGSICRINESRFACVLRVRPVQRHRT